MSRLAALFLILAAACWGQSPGIQIVPYTGTCGSQPCGATPTFTATAGYTDFEVTLSQSITSSTFSSPAVGAGTFVVAENGTGGYNITWPANFIGFSQLSSTAASYWESWTWQYDGTNVTATGHHASTASSSTDWSNPANILVVDPFIANSTSANLIGILGWNTFGTGSTIAATTGAAGHLGGYTLSTSAGAINDTSAVDLSGASNTKPFPPISGETNWTMTFKVSTPASLSQVSIYAGIDVTNGAQAYDTGGVWIKYSNANACTGSYPGTSGSPTTDSTWIGETRNSSTSSFTSSLGSIATSTAYWLRIRSTSAGTILFAVKPEGGSWGTEYSLATNVPSVVGVPVIKVTTCETVAKVLTVREFRFAETGLN